MEVLEPEIMLDRSEIVLSLEFLLYSDVDVAVNITEIVHS